MVNGKTLVDCSSIQLGFTKLGTTQTKFYHLPLEQLYLLIFIRFGTSKSWLPLFFLIKIAELYEYFKNAETMFSLDENNLYGACINETEKKIALVTKELAKLYNSCYGKTLQTDPITRSAKL